MLLNRTFEYCGLHFEWYCMMKMVWNWIHTFEIICGLMFVWVLSIDTYVIIEISELHWWSKPHRLRYQVVRSWWRSSCTLRHMRCTAWVVLNLPWSFFLDSLVIFRSGVTLWQDLLIRVFRKMLVVIIFVEYFGCVDPCDIYVIVLCWVFLKDWIIKKLIGFLFWLNGIYYKTLFSLAYPCFSCYVVNCNNYTMYTSQ